MIVSNDAITNQDEGDTIVSYRIVASARNHLAYRPKRLEASSTKNKARSDSSERAFCWVIFELY